MTESSFLSVLSKTFSVLALNILHLKKLLSPRQTNMASIPMSYLPENLVGIIQLIREVVMILNTANTSSLSLISRAMCDDLFYINTAKTTETTLSRLSKNWSKPIYNTHLNTDVAGCFKWNDFSHKKFKVRSMLRLWHVHLCMCSTQNNS